MILSTGFYKEPFLPESVKEKTVEELAELAEHEILDGIGENKEKASVIGEFGTSRDQMTPLEEKVFEAMSLAAVRTPGSGYHTYDAGNIRSPAGGLSVKPWSETGEDYHWPYGSFPGYGENF